MPTTTTTASPLLEQVPSRSGKDSKIAAKSGRFWALLGLGVALNIGVIVLGAYLLVFSNRTVAPPLERRISVPFAAEKDLWKKFGAWVVQEDGRNKPFDTFARESVRSLTGTEHLEKNDPVAVIVSWMMLYDKDENQATRIGQGMKCDWDHYPFILCDFHELREKIYREERGEGAELTEEELHGKYVQPAVLRHSQTLKKLAMGAAAKREADSKAVLLPIETKAQEAYGRLKMFERVQSGELFQIVSLDRKGRTWFNLHNLREAEERQPGRENITPEAKWNFYLLEQKAKDPETYGEGPLQLYPAQQVKEVLASYDGLQGAYRSNQASEFSTAADHFFQTVENVSKQFNDYPGTTTSDLELWYNRIMPFRWAWVCGLLSAVLLGGYLIAGMRWPLGGKGLYFAGMSAYLATLACAITGFYCRITISERPPVGTMYETIIWVATMTASFGLVLELIYRRGVIALAGGLVATLAFVLADQMPLTFKPNIEPLVAVLRSQYWLIIHVLTEVSSYAAFALAWGLGNLNLGLILWAPHRRDLIKTLSLFCYRAIQIGVILVAAGTLLGGFWAAESWGRFWGWDPKEVWALITLLCYVIPLHARYVGWVKDFGLAVCSVVCFSAVMMSWYGVNFVLGAGLHSYGFGSGDNWWLFWAWMINIDLVVMGVLRYQYFQPVKLAEA